MVTIDDLIRKVNRYAHSSEMMAQVIKENHIIAERDAKQMPLLSIMFKKDRRSNRKKFTTPTSNEIAMILVNDEDMDEDKLPFECDLKINFQLLNDESEIVPINILSPNLQTMIW